MIQYQILRTSIIKIVWQTVRRITNEILGTKRLRNRLYAAVPLFNNRLQMMLNCFKNKRDVLLQLFLPHWHLLWNFNEQTHDNMESICFIHQRKKHFVLHYFITKNQSNVAYSIIWYSYLDIKFWNTCQCVGDVGENCSVYWRVDIVKTWVAIVLNSGTKEL